MRQLFLFILILSGLILLSCSYEPGEALPKNYRTVYVAGFLNDTSEQEFPILLSDSVKRALSEEGTLVVTSQLDKTDLLIAVRIGKYTKNILTYDPISGLPDEIFLGVEIKLVVQDVHTKEILRNQIIEDSVTYTLITEPRQTDIDAKNELVNQLTEKITLSAIKGFY